jgi:ElaB/YqjD/DUF883 family membrane-anchored ribosome-binding protein
VCSKTGEGGSHPRFACPRLAKGPTGLIESRTHSHQGEPPCPYPPLSAASSEIKSLINEAERMLNEANAATGEKADVLKMEGLKLLSSSIAKANELERLAVDTVKSFAHSTDNLVHENPWRAIAVSGAVGATIGLVLGVALTRK